MVGMTARLCPLLLVLGTVGGAAEWAPVRNQMMTRWAEQVTPDKAWPKYPRPQMVRRDWRNLNGLWDYAITTRDAGRPAEWDGQILVPFAVESALSGVKKPVKPDQRLWYRRGFTTPPAWRGRRLLLHFGAVDWQADVYVNGLHAGRHRGGYTPFTLDITGLVRADGEQELVVSVWDPTNTGTQPRGKQVLEPEGIWYTAVTGIWQTVWLEPAPDVSIRRLVLTPDVDRSAVAIRVTTSGDASGMEVLATAFDGARRAGQAAGRPGASFLVPVASPKLWSPDSPHLYTLRVSLRRGGRTADEVESYFGLRKISMGRDTHGRLLFHLNNEPLFHLGPLDQGWWPDGLYTAPTDEALRYDIEVTKKLGFNMARKHVKVEPARWYYWCDKLGLLVWQDMPSGFLGGRGPLSLFVAPTDAGDAPRDGVSAAQFESELDEMMDALHSHPSIVVWVPFNEGWGQYDTARIARLVKERDPSRLVNSASGWTDRGAGDMYDAHIYPGPALETEVGANRATVLGEFGGLGWPVEDHLWWNKRNWGYRTLTSRDELNRKYLEVVGNAYGLRGLGMAAAVYTQTTDVEGEVNGLMTYDRAVIKFDEAPLRELHAGLYAKPPVARTLAPTSQHGPQPWRYTFTTPPAGWETAAFDDRSWGTGAAPFQPGNNALFRTGTVWRTKEIWMRRDFTADAPVDDLWIGILQIVRNATVYLNGEPVLELRDERARERHYTHHDLTRFRGLMRAGRNVLAIHAEHPTGEGAVDAGLYTLE